MTLPQQIALAKVLLRQAKPRSRRQVQLELRLRDLVLKQLRSENRKSHDNA